MSRGFASTARRATLIALMAVGLSSLLTVCWGTLTTALTGITPVLGPSARATLQGATRGREITSGLMNLTYSPGAERNPAWSPDGQRIAFTSDGIDANGDGRLDSVGATRQLYTMLPDGTGLQRYAVSAGSVAGLCWHPDGKCIYLIVYDAGVYNIRAIELASKVVTQIYAATNVINSVSIAPSGTLLYFDISATNGKGDIYSLPLPVGSATPTQLTRSIYTSRHPIVAGTGNQIIYESNRTGRWRIWTMALDGSNQQMLTTASVGGDDTDAQPTADNKIVFTSTRFINSGDLRNDANVWIMDYLPEGSVLDATAVPPTQVTPTIRFFPDVSDFSNQLQPSAFPSTSRVNDLLFVSDKDGNEEIYLGVLSDSDAPYVSEPPTVAPKTASPGAVLTISVPVSDQGTGVRNVWLQIKDPDPANIDMAGQNHVITAAGPNWGARAMPPWTGDLNYPVEYGPFNPATKTYLDISQATSHPGYYARAGVERLFADEGQGYPEVPAHWLVMYDDGTHGDVRASDNIFTCQWTTPSTGSDWYLDVIVEDASFITKDVAGRWHGNRRRFDNIGGCSTLSFTGSRHILLVDDYMDGQRFLSTGLPPVNSSYDAVCYLNAPYYFANIVTNYALPDAAPTYTTAVSPFAAGSEFGGADIWRLLCRGPVPSTVLDRYLPKTVTQVSASDGRTPVDVRHGDRLVVWSSPSSWYRLLGPLPGGSGSLLESSVQASLTQFITDGGRLFVMGPDLPTGLTMGGSRTNAFLSNILGVKPVRSSEKVYNGVIQYPGSYFSSLSAPRWRSVDSNLRRNANPGQYTFYDPNAFKDPNDPLLKPILLEAWDTLELALSGDKYITKAFHVTDNTGQGDHLIGVAKEFPNYNSRLVFWTFSYDHLDPRDRAYPTLDTMEWLMDGAVAGTVVRINDLQPISNAMVVITDTSTATTRPVGAARTDGQGKYLIQGLRPGAEYTITVTANGYYGEMSKTLGVKGGLITTGDAANFFLSRDTNTCILWGYVTQGILPVTNAEVKATASGSSAEYSTQTDTVGRFEFSNLPTGPYTLVATHPVTSETGRANPNPVLTAGEKLRADINLSSSVVIAQTLSGSITGSGTPLPGVTVLLREGSATRATLTTDLNGNFSQADLPSGIYTLDVSAPGFLNASRTVTYDAVTGLNIIIDMQPLSNDPTTAIISGRVYDSITGAPLGNATVDLLISGVLKASQATSSIFQQSASPYNFTFSVTAGSYQLRISKPGWRTQTRMVSLSPGDLLSNLEFRMEPLLTVSSGTILFALPGDLTNHTVAEVFGLSGATLTRIDNKLTYYDTATHTYVMHTAATPITMQAGRAYWTRLDAPITITTEGDPADITQPFQLLLQKGWNLIGNPFSFTVDLFDCGVILDGAPLKGWNDAVLSGTANSVAYTWDGRAYMPTTMLMPYRGYWVYVNAPAGVIRMVVSNRSSSRGTPLGPRARRAPSSTAWQVRLEARAGDCRDTANNFGVAPDVRDGAVNPLNLLEPPSPPAHYVGLAFLANGETGTLASDLRAPGSTEKTWRVRVTTDLPETDVIVAWPELAAQLPAGLQMVVKDLTTGQTVYANTTGSTVFRSGTTGAVRDFTVTVSPRTGALTVGDIRGTGVRGRAETLLSFSVSEEARVDITLRTATGRLVRTLASGVAAHAGVNTLTWARVDAAGRPLPRGTYLCEVRAASAGGRLARGVGVVTLLAVR